MSHPANLLCLTCSSSPSPKANSIPFYTPCCSRPICHTCLSRNPRLRGYNPCLSCLAGVVVVGNSSSKRENDAMKNIEVPGASGRSKSEEENMFVLGDSDDDEVAAEEAQDAPPSYHSVVEQTTQLPIHDTAAEQAPKQDESPTIDTTNFSEYHIQPGDTLRGIALKYGIDGAKLCQLNALPLSTLSTTPHLLHTRRTLKFPPGKRPPPPPTLDPETIAARNRERAEKRFQFVTKEVDWRVAKAYVALAEDEDNIPRFKEDSKVLGRSQEAGTSRVLEDAVDQYLEDDEWESTEGRQPRIQGFPPFASSSRKHR